MNIKRCDVKLCNTLTHVLIRVNLKMTEVK